MRTPDGNTWNLTDDGTLDTVVEWQAGFATGTIRFDSEGIDRDYAGDLTAAAEDWIGDLVDEEIWTDHALEERYDRASEAIGKALDRLRRFGEPCDGPPSAGFVVQQEALALTLDALEGLAGQGWSERLTDPVTTGDATAALLQSLADALA